MSSTVNSIGNVCIHSQATNIDGVGVSSQANNVDSVRVSSQVNNIGNVCIHTHAYVNNPVTDKLHSSEEEVQHIRALFDDEEYRMVPLPDGVDWAEHGLEPIDHDEEFAFFDDEEWLSDSFDEEESSITPVTDKLHSNSKEEVHHIRALFDDDDEEEEDTLVLFSGQFLN